MLSDLLYYQNLDISPAEKIHMQHKKILEKFKLELKIDKKQVNQELKKIIDSSLQSILKDYQ